MCFENMKNCVHWIATFFVSKTIDYICFVKSFRNIHRKSSNCVVFEFFISLLSKLNQTIWSLLFAKYFVLRKQTNLTTQINALIMISWFLTIATKLWLQWKSNWMTIWILMRSIYIVMNSNWNTMFLNIVEMKSTNKLKCLSTNCDTKLIEICNLKRKNEKWFEKCDIEFFINLKLMIEIF